MDTQTKAQQPDMNEIQRTAQVFWKSTGKAICLYNTKKRGTVGGFFNDAEKFAAAAFEQSALADAPAVFMSLQVLAPGAEGNKLTEHAAAGFRQEHVEFYAWLLIDCDPVRGDGNRRQSTTETEKALVKSEFPALASLPSRGSSSAGLAEAFYTARPSSHQHAGLYLASVQKGTVWLPSRLS